MCYMIIFALLTLTVCFVDFSPNWHFSVFGCHLLGEVCLAEKFCCSKQCYPGIFFVFLFLQIQWAHVTSVHLLVTLLQWWEPIKSSTCPGQVQYSSATSVPFMSHSRGLLFLYVFNMEKWVGQSEFGVK